MALDQASANGVAQPASALLPGTPAPHPSNGLAGKKVHLNLSQSAPVMSKHRPVSQVRETALLKAAMSATLYTVRTAKVTEKKRQSEMVWLSPDSDFRHSWDAFMSFVLIIIGTVLPFRIGFQVEIELVSWLGLFSVLVDLLFVVDVVLNMNTGYTKLDGQVEMGRKNARMYYIRHWFLIDLCASLPIRYIGWILKDISQESKGLGMDFGNHQPHKAIPTSTA